MKFSYDVKLKGIAEDFKVTIPNSTSTTTTDSSSSEDEEIKILTVFQPLDNEIGFRLEILNSDAQKTLEIMPFSPSFPSIYKASDLTPFDAYPLVVQVEPQFSTKFDIFIEDSEPYASPTLGSAAFFGIAFNPMLVMYLFKFMQILDYLGILGVEIPQNLREFLVLINQDPLDFLP